MELSLSLVVFDERLYEASICFALDLSSALNLPVCLGELDGGIFIQPVISLEGCTLALL